MRASTLLTCTADHAEPPRAVEMAFAVSVSAMPDSDVTRRVPRWFQVFGALNGAGSHRRCPG
jgi:hypothetical protein